MKRATQSGVDAQHCGFFTLIGEAGDAEIGDPARHDPTEMREVGSDVDRKAVQRHPALDSDSEGGDFRLARPAPDPDADAARRAMRVDAEIGEAGDDPSPPSSSTRSGCRFMTPAAAAVHARCAAALRFSMA